MINPAMPNIGFHPLPPLTQVERSYFSERSIAQGALQTTNSIQAMAAFLPYSILASLFLAFSIVFGIAGGTIRAMAQDVGARLSGAPATYTTDFFKFTRSCVHRYLEMRAVQTEKRAQIARVWNDFTENPTPNSLMTLINSYQARDINPELVEAVVPAIIANYAEYIRLSTDWLNTPDRYNLQKEIKGQAAARALDTLQHNTQVLISLLDPALVGFFEFSYE